MTNPATQPNASAATTAHNTGRETFSRAISDELYPPSLPATTPNAARDEGQTKWTFNGESVLDAKGRNVCTKANGPLIAAAPDLLAALQYIVAWSPDAGRWNAETARDMANAAIARATGAAQ